MNDFLRMLLGTPQEGWGEGYNSMGFNPDVFKNNISGLFGGQGIQQEDQQVPMQQQQQGTLQKQPMPGFGEGFNSLGFNSDLFGKNLSSLFSSGNVYDDAERQRRRAQFKANSPTMRPF